MPRLATSIFLLKGRVVGPFTWDEANEKPWGDSYPGGSEATFRFKPLFSHDLRRFSVWTWGYPDPAPGRRM